MASITKYQSDIDSKIFDSESEQKAYDASLRNQVVINQFLDKHFAKPTEGRAGPARGIASRAIGLWLSEQ